MSRMYLKGSLYDRVTDRFRSYGRMKLNRVSTVQYPILVTGAHRSGTTWLGRALAVAEGTRYLDELFRPPDGLIPWGPPVELWFQYVTPENEARFIDPVARALAFAAPRLRQIPQIRKVDHVRRVLIALSASAGARATLMRPIVKDPAALFSSEWLADRFGVVPIVMVRNPGAFVASIVRLGWRHPLRHFLQQPELMERHLASFESEIYDAAARPLAPMDEAILLWRILYTHVEYLRCAHDDWIFLRHEDLSLDPISQFERLYEQLGLHWSDRVAAALQPFVNGSKSASADPFQVRRNATENLWEWRRTLSSQDILHVRRRTDDVAALYYASDEW
jgi:hypothetical protein